MICDKLYDCVECEKKQMEIAICPNQNRKQCIESTDNRTTVKCEEKNKKYLLKNTKRKRIFSYRVDGGIIVVDDSVPSGINKCDYLFLIESETPIAVLTELKGSDVPKALKQIDGTLSLFKDFFKDYSNVYARVIVSSVTPRLKASPGYVKLQKKMQQYKGNLKIAEKQLMEKDTSLNA